MLLIALEIYIWPTSKRVVRKKMKIGTKSSPMYDDYYRGRGLQIKVHFPPPHKKNTISIYV